MYGLDLSIQHYLNDNSLSLFSDRGCKEEELGFFHRRETLMSY